MTRIRPSVDELRCLFRYSPDTGKLLNADGTDPCTLWKDAYLTVNYRKRKIYVHTIVWAMMTGEYPSDTVDHRDLDGLNNRWGNLREASQPEQQANRRLFKNNKSGHRGVYRVGRRWSAQVRFDKKTHHLGTFDEPELAAAAVQKAREARWGEFARAA